MKIIIISFVSLVLTAQNSVGQGDSKNAIKATGYFGYAIGEKGNLKKIMLSSGAALSWERKIKTTLFFNLGFDVSSLKFAHYDSGNNSVFSTNYQLLIPVSIKKYYRVGRKSDLFWDFGLAPAYYFYSNELTNNSKSTSKRNIGIKIGTVGKLGFKTQLTNSIYFDVGLNSYYDLFVLYKSKDDKLTSRSNTLMYSLYFNLK